MTITRIVLDFEGDLTEHEQEKIADRMREYADGVVAVGYDNLEAPRSSSHVHVSTRKDACPGCWGHAIDQLASK